MPQSNVQQLGGNVTALLEKLQDPAQLEAMAAKLAQKFPVPPAGALDIPQGPVDGGLLAQPIPQAQLSVLQPPAQNNSVGAALTGGA